MFYTSNTGFEDQEAHQVPIHLQMNTAHYTIEKNALSNFEGIHRESQ